jgi:bacteriorhodopsin
MPEESKTKLHYGSLLQNSFLTTYIVLFGYTAITLIEALRTPSANVRHIMNIETTVSMIAGIVYGTFLEKIKQPQFTLSEIVPIRYMDWMITTPLILLAIVLFYNNDSHLINYKCYGIIVILNWLMLLFGYLGERHSISRVKGLLLGFVFFALLLVYMYMYKRRIQINMLQLLQQIHISLLKILVYSFKIAMDFWHLLPNNNYISLA